MFSSFHTTPEGEALPWYRAKNYRGDLTEDEKRELDSIRHRPPHRASEFKGLSADVQGYIKSLEYDLEQKRRQSNFNGSAFLMFCALLSAFAAYQGTGTGSDGDLFSYLASLVLVVVGVVLYRVRDARITNEMRSTDNFNPSDEGLKQAWELEHILDQRSRAAGD